MNEFKREERYIVVKRKHLQEGDEEALREFLQGWQIPTVECVVVESDWPEYETVWQMIETRVTGEINALAEPNIIFKTALKHTLDKMLSAMRAANNIQAEHDAQWITVRVLARGDNENTAADAVHSALQFAYNKKPGCIIAWDDLSAPIAQHPTPRNSPSA